MPSSLPPGPDENMIPLPPVILTSSRAFERKFCLYLLAVSRDVDAGGKSAAEYSISNL